MGANVRARVAGTGLRLIVSLIVLSGCLRGDPASAQALTGTYLYRSPEGPVSLTLQEQGATLHGRMTGADGSVFQLEGTIESGHATGLIRIGEGSGWFAVGPVGEGLTMVVAELDAATGQPDLTQSWSLDFARTEVAAHAAPAAGRLPDAPGAPAAGGSPEDPPARAPGHAPAPGAGAAEPAAERDPALVGLWSHSDSYQSGDFFATTRLHMQVNPDGTYLYGAGDLSLGGAYTGRAGGGNVTSGRWRTQGGIVYVMEDGSPQWMPHARYYVEGGSLMFTFANGKRQVWHRQR